MRQRRTIYFNDARHYYLFVFEPPMTMEDAWRPVDEVAGTSVDTFCYGVERFLTDAARAGVDGLIVVDLPPEHDEELCQPAARHGIDFIRLATPTTDAKRLPKVLANASGFIYYVSVAGVTGGSAPTPERLEGAVGQLREHTELPIAVGFGIRTAEQAATIGRFSDAVVVGSALVDCIEHAVTADEAVERVHTLVSELAESVRACREVSEPQAC